jgi:redox-sensitive bicupin YhaK (pirin superfamily)
VVGATLTAGQTAEYRLGASRKAYLVPAAGVVEVNGVRVAARDGVAVQDEDVLRITAVEDAEIILVDTV